MRRRGFTLVELLVVIGIIALLIGILLPSLNRARATAKGIACLSNLRQMCIAAQAYVNDNRGHYPSARFTVTTAAGDQYDYGWDFSSLTPAGQPTKQIPGLLWRTTDPTRIQQCPAFEGNANADDPYTGYNYNTSYIGHGDGEDVPTPAKATAVRHPSTTVLFGDGQYSAGANKYMRAPFPNPGDKSFTYRYSGTQGFRHLKKTNAAFCDGHAESLGDRFTATSDGPANVAAGTGFLSSDNAAYTTD